MALVLLVLPVLLIVAVVVIGLFTNWYGLGKKATPAPVTLLADTTAPLPILADTTAPLTTPSLTTAPVTTTSAPAVYNFLSFMDAPGTDMAGSPIAGVASSSLCAAQCAGSPGCAGIAYSPASQQCWLKSSLTNSNLSVTGPGAAQRVVGYLASSALIPSVLASPGALQQGMMLASPAQLYAALMQKDGNLVVYNLTSGTSVWSTATTSSAVSVTQQVDGNLVVYDKSLKAVWASFGLGKAALAADNYTLKMQDDGNLATYNSLGKAVWASNTVGK